MEECQQHHSPFQERGAKQSAIGAVRVKEHPDKGDEEKGIAQIGDGDAPGVTVHSKDTALHVLVEAALIETYGMEGSNVIHGDPLLLLFLTVIHRDGRDIVGSGTRPLMILHLETVELY